jgi:hypothetical protein
LAQVELEQQAQSLEQAVQTLYLVLLQLLAVVVEVLTMAVLLDQVGHQEALVGAAMVAGQPLAVLELQGKVTLEEMVLAQSLVLTPSAQVAVVEQVLLELLEQYLAVKVAQEFAPQ